eukprot:55618-Pyramimonas_sp.AAC.1
MTSCSGFSRATTTSAPGWSMTRRLGAGDRCCRRLVATPALKCQLPRARLATLLSVVVLATSWPPTVQPMRGRSRSSPMSA